MLLLKKLWQGEDGLVLSAEAVVVGTLGVLGAGIGLKAVSESVNQELADVGQSIRGLDQSYSVQGMRGCHAWTAGSHFRQAEPCDLPGADATDQPGKFEKRTVPQQSAPAETAPADQPSPPHEKSEKSPPVEAETPQPVQDTVRGVEPTPRIHKTGFDSPAP